MTPSQRVGARASALDRELAAGQDWAERLLRHLVSIPSVVGEPTSIIDAVADHASGLQLDVEVLSTDQDRIARHPEYSPVPAGVVSRSPVLHARWPYGKGEELLLFAHTDSEPVHLGWRSDPFVLRVEKGRATGLGVADDKAGVVCILAALRALRRAGVEPSRTPRLVLGAGKLGGSRGTLPGVVAADGVSAAIYCHPAESGRGLGQLKVASRGVVQLELTVPGETPEPVEERTPVSADPRTGRNPISRAMRLAGALTDSVQAPDRVWALTAMETKDPVPFGVPASTRLTVACWFSTGGVDDVLQYATAIADLAAVDEWEREHPVAVCATGLRANPASCAGTAFADHIRSTIEARTGQSSRDYRWHSASDIRFPIRCLGVPTVGFGPTAGQFYGANEWVDLASMHATTAILVDLLGMSE